MVILKQVIGKHGLVIKTTKRRTNNVFYKEVRRSSKQDKKKMYNALASEAKRNKQNSLIGNIFTFTEY